jgi:aryl-alcohol dehydrogenase-like predicted oxidoreductase
MKYRKFGCQQADVSEIGFGGWQLGNKESWDSMNEEEGITLVKEAINKGVNFFDTAPGYAGGLSEIIIGKAVEGVREKVIINTKFGHNADGTSDFNINNIEPSIKNSLQRLKTTYLDSIILHNPEHYILEGKTKHFEELARCKEMGLIHNYGVSIDSVYELSLVLQNLELDVVEIMFNIFHQDVSKLFAKAKQKGISLVIKVPLDSGWLTGKYRLNSKFTGIRSRWNQETIQRRGSLVEDLIQITQDDELTKYAIAFILSYEEVTTVIPGIKDKTQLIDHIVNGEFILNPKIKAEFIQLYAQKIRNNQLPW